MNHETGFKIIDSDMHILEPTSPAPQTIARSLLFAAYFAWLRWDPQSNPPYHAAIHGHTSAGHVTRTLRSEKDDQIGHFLRPAESA